MPVALMTRCNRRKSFAASRRRIGGEDVCFVERRRGLARKHLLAQGVHFRPHFVQDDRARHVCQQRPRRLGFKQGMDFGQEAQDGLVVVGGRHLQTQ